MKKQDIVAKIAHDTGITKSSAAAAVESLIEGITKSLKKGDPVSFDRSLAHADFLVDGDPSTQGVSGADGHFEITGLQPGLSPACAEWVHDHSLAAVCADNLAVEVMSAEGLASDMPLAFHCFCLRDMGCPLGEMFNLDALAADCAADGRYAFLLSAPPIAFTNGFGSPVNPLALK